MNEPCARCKSKGIDTPAALTAYWGPPLCRPCAMAVTQLLDEHDKWPPVPWDDDEEVRLNG